MAGRGRLQAVLFDWGGTLSDVVEINEEAWRLAAQSLTPEREQEIVTKLVEANEAAWSLSASEHKSTRIHDLLGSVAAELELELTEELIAEAAGAHMNAWEPLISHDPDARFVLEELRDRSLRIGLISNTMWPRTFHERLLERDGLLNLIDVRFYTSELEITKPHPEIFQSALAALGVVEPSRAVFVGDRPFDDIYGAKRAGLKAVLRPNPEVPAHDVHPDATINRLPELLDVIERWDR